MYGVNKSRVALPPLAGTFKPIRRPPGYAPYTPRTRVTPSPPKARVVTLTLPPIDGPVSIEFLRRTKGWSMPRSDQVPKTDRVGRQTQRAEVRRNLYHPTPLREPPFIKKLVTTSKSLEAELPVKSTKSRTYRPPPACATSSGTLYKKFDRKRMEREATASERRRDTLRKIQIKAGSSMIRALTARKNNWGEDLGDIDEEESRVLTEKIQQELRKESIAERRRMSIKHDMIAARLKFQRSKSLSAPVEESAPPTPRSREESTTKSDLPAIEEGQDATANSSDSTESGESTSSSAYSGFQDEQSSETQTDDLSERTRSDNRSNLP